MTDVSGKEYLDGSGGPAVFCLGHSHPEVNEAIRNQLDLVAHAYRYNFSSDPLEELTELVGRRAGSDLQQMVFTCGGSEAVESALKIALHFHWANGEPTRSRFIARRRSWHGNTLGALSVSDLSDRQAPYRGSMLPVSATHTSSAISRAPRRVASMARVALVSVRLRRLTSVVTSVPEFCMRKISSAALPPMVQAGMHINAIIKNPESYEHVHPFVVGNDTYQNVNGLQKARNDARAVATTWGKWLVMASAASWAGPPTARCTS